MGPGDRPSFCPRRPLGLDPFGPKSQFIQFTPVIHYRPIVTVHSAADSGSSGAHRHMPELKRGSGGGGGGGGGVVMVSGCVRSGGTLLAYFTFSSL